MRGDLCIFIEEEKAVNEQGKFNDLEERLEMNTRPGLNVVDKDGY